MSAWCTIYFCCTQTLLTVFLKTIYAVTCCIPNDSNSQLYDGRQKHHQDHYQPRDLTEMLPRTTAQTWSSIPMATALSVIQYTYWQTVPVPSYTGSTTKLSKLSSTQFMSRSQDIQTVFKQGQWELQSSRLCKLLNYLWLENEFCFRYLFSYMSLYNQLLVKMNEQLNNPITVWAESNLKST